MNVLLWIRRIALGTVVLIVGLYLTILIIFQISNRLHRSELLAGSQLVETKLGPIEYISQGEGPVVLFVHGTPGGYDQGSIMLELSSGGSYTYLTPSRPGYLKTPLSVGETPREQADAYAALLDELGIDQVAIIGGSGGGPSAMEFARHYPERVWGLVLNVALLQTAEPAPEPPPPSQMQQIVKFLFGEGFMEWAFIQAVKFFPEQLTFFHQVYPDSWPRMLADEEKMDLFVTMMASATYQYDMRKTGQENDVKQFTTLDIGNTEGIDAPTLIIHGTADENAPFEGAQAVAQEIGQAETLWLEGGDHLASLTRNEEIGPVLSDFLARHAPN